MVGDGISRRREGAQSKVEGRKLKMDQKTFLHSDMLKFCLEKNPDTTILFLYTVIFLDKNILRYKIMG